MTISPDDLTGVQRASVVVDGNAVARLERLADRVRFSYLPDATHPVATGLPLRPEPYDTHAPGALPPFFAGLLPEGRRMTAIRQLVKTSADDEFTLLLAVGLDTVGNVSVVPEGDAIAVSFVPAIDVSGDDWSAIDFDAVYQRSIGREYDPFGVPGVQNKVSARMMTLAVRRSSSPLATHILKLNPPEFPHLVENEAFFMVAAGASGLRAADVRLVHDAKGRAGLLVERFDRVVNRSGITRVAQEDACQVLGRYPADKYAVSTEQVSTALADVCSARLLAAAALLRQLVFVYVSANGDAHAKNFSVLRAGDEWRVAPAYDLPTSHVYRDKTMALPLNAKKDDRLGRADFLGLAAHLGLREAPAVRIVDEVANAVDTWIDQLGNLPFDERRLHDLRKAVLYRQRRLRGK